VTTWQRIHFSSLYKLFHVGVADVGSKVVARAADISKTMTMRASISLDAICVTLPFESAETQTEAQTMLVN